MQHAVTVASAAVPLLQARHHHIESLTVSNQLHQKNLLACEAFHNEEMKLADLLHRKECAVERELHLDQMARDHDIARREGIRDVWSQRNHLIQTLMVVDTLMFSCSYSLLIQGDPPVSTPPVLIRLYSAAMGLSLSLLFASIWFCLKIQTRLAFFDMHRPDIIYDCGQKHRTFNEYYSCHCSLLARVAFAGFYAGTATTIVQAAIFCFSKMYYQYANLTAGTIFLAICAVAIIGPVVIRVGREGFSSSAEDDKVDVGGLAADAEEMLRRVRERDESAMLNMDDDDNEEDEEGGEEESGDEMTEPSLYEENNNVPTRQNAL